VPNSALAQIQSIEFSNPQLTDSFGTPISTINVGDMILFSADVRNHLDEEVDFVYVLTLDDLQSATWIAGSLEPGQGLSPAVSYTAKYGGEYTVGLYLVKPLQQILKPDDPQDYSVFKIEKNQLAAPIFFKINVEHPFPPQAFPVSDENVKDNLEFITESEISDASFNKENKEISFTVSGPSGTSGSLILKVPVFLLDNIYEVTKYGQPYHNWSVERIGAFNYITINYSHSSHGYSIHGLQSNTPLTTNSGYTIRYNWLPFPISDEVEQHILTVSISTLDNEEPKNSKFNIQISKFNSVRFNEDRITGDDATENLRIGQDTLYKDPNIDSEELEMEITLLEYDGMLIGERADPMQKITIIPEYPMGVFIILLTAITFVILATRIRTLKHIHF